MDEWLVRLTVLMEMANRIRLHRGEAPHEVKSRRIFSMSELNPDEEEGNERK